MQAQQTDHRPVTDSARAERAWLGKAEAYRQQALLRVAQPPLSQPDLTLDRRRGDRRQA